MPKVRFDMVCECCKAPISVGRRYVKFHGRPWLPEHVDAYLAKRSSIAASAPRSTLSV